MRLGFSSVACPDWDLDTIISRAPGMGYAAVELAARLGSSFEATWPALKADPAGVGKRFHDAGMELICLATDAAMSCKGSELAAAKADARSAIELAGTSGVPIVRVLIGRAGEERRDMVLGRVVEALRELAPVAAARGVTIALENSGDLGSRDVWFVIDAVESPFVQVCWSPLAAAAAGDRMTLAVPRVARMMALTRVSDARVEGGRLDYVLPGQGSLDLEHYLDLLRGVGYEGGLIFHWPKATIPALAGPDEALPAAATALKAMLDKLAAVKELTAYKGDKNVPRYSKGGVQG